MDKDKENNVMNEDKEKIVELEKEIIRRKKNNNFNNSIIIILLAVLLIVLCIVAFNNVR